MKIIVITQVPSVAEGGNLSLATGVYIERKPMSAENDWRGEYQTLAEWLHRHGVGALLLAFRTPVFQLGELLVLDEDHRDQFGREPGKWSVDYESFDTIEAAAARAREVHEARITSIADGVIAVT